jgi:uncharacterized membrane protein
MDNETNLNKWYNVGLPWFLAGFLSFLGCLASRNILVIRVGICVWIGMIVVGLMFSMMKYADE